VFLLLHMLSVICSLLTHALGRAQSNVRAYLESDHFIEAIVQGATTAAEAVEDVKMWVGTCGMILHVRPRTHAAVPASGCDGWKSRGKAPPSLACLPSCRLLPLLLPSPPRTHTRIH